MGSPFPLGSPCHRKGFGLAADILSVRYRILDGVANYQSHRTSEQGIQTSYEGHGSYRRRDVDVSLSRIRRSNDGLSMELSLLREVVPTLHTKCRLTLRRRYLRDNSKLFLK